MAQRMPRSAGFDLLHLPADVLWGSVSRFRRTVGRWPHGRHLGIQQRIMLYVTIGLVLMFGSNAFLGLESIKQATDLVYAERLTRAFTIAGIIQSDFRHIAGDVQEQAGLLADGPQLDETASGLLAHLSRVDPFRFFRTTGVWVLGPDGRVLAAAGSPSPNEMDQPSSMVSAISDIDSADFAVVTAPAAASDRQAFAAVIIRIGDRGDAARRVVVVDLEAANSPAPYVPSSEDQVGAGVAPTPEQLSDPASQYHLEVVGPDGRVALGIGPDEDPGGLSYHFPVIQGLQASQAVSLLHEPGPGESFESHVMAVVPLTGSRFYLVLEQAVDVALALPRELEQRLLLLTIVGFLTTLAVAWITTGRVVKPTQQLTAVAQRIAQGDLESPICVAAQDEVGQLAQSLESMRQQLRNAYQQLEDTNKRLELQVRERTARLGELLTKIISAQEDERARLARELHDETAQTLAALSIALDRARDNLDETQPEAAERLQEARTIAAGLLEETRRLILDLRPMALDDLGLAPAIRWYAETHLEEAGIAASVEVDQPSKRLPKHLEVSLFRMVQEAVNNVVRHAHARHARIELAFRDSVASVRVTDDGRGFDAEAVLGLAVPARSVGLLGMQERVRLLNGRLSIESQPGKGTVISIEVPIEEGVAR
jgi:signal transduction histidine kinase